MATVFLRDDLKSKRVNLLIAAAPKDERNKVVPGRYALIFVVTAHNSDAQRYSIEVSWDGEIGDEPKQIWEHLSVSAPVALPPSDQ